MILKTHSSKFFKTLLMDKYCTSFKARSLEIREQDRSYKRLIDEHFEIAYIKSKESVAHSGWTI